MDTVSVVLLATGAKIVEPVRALMGYIRPLYVQAMVHAWPNMPVIRIQVFVASVQKMVWNHFQRGPGTPVLV